MNATNLTIPQDRTPARPNTIMMEAHNLSQLTEAATPLIGGDNPGMPFIFFF